MKNNGYSIEKRILKRIYRSKAGTVFTPSNFLDIGNRSAIDLALHRLMKKNVLRRLARGLYDYPQEHPELGTLSPNIEGVAKALAVKDQLRLQQSGAYSA